MPFPHNLSPSRGDPELSWDQFCANLSAAGVDCLRVKLCGQQYPLEQPVDSFEPKLGQWNHWDGRLDEMVSAMSAHNIGLQAIPFDNVEFVRKWAAHAWNAQNGGFLTDVRDVFRTDAALAAAKNRIDAIYDLCGEVIDAWELVAEMSFLVTPQFWGVSTWAEMQPVVREILVPWVDALANYIHAKSDAPVGNGHIFAPNGFADDPNHPSRLRNEIYRTPTLDFALIDWYGTNLAEKKAWLRACQDYAPETPVYVEQYAPWAIGSTWPPEEAPFAASLRHEWVATCGEFGCVGPMRWQEIRGDMDEWWGVAHPNMAQIAGVTRAFGDAVDVYDWGGRGQSWDDRLDSPNLSLVSSWGDGERLTAFVSWLDATAHDLAIGGLLDGAYTVRVFDWQVGDQVLEIEATSTDGLMELETVPVRETATVLYVEPKPPQPPTETRTLRVMMHVLDEDGNVEATYAGELQELPR